MHNFLDYYLPGVITGWATMSVFAAWAKYRLDIKRADASAKRTADYIAGGRP